MIPLGDATNTISEGSCPRLGPAGFCMGRQSSCEVGKSIFPMWDEPSFVSSAPHLDPRRLLSWQT